MASNNNIERFRTQRGWKRPELARRMNTSAQQVERLEKGQRNLTQDWIDRAAVALGVQPTDIIGPFDDGKELGALPVATDHQPTRDASEGEVAGVRRWDLSYAMGPGTNVDEDYLEGEEVLFDIGFLRSLTVSAPSQLRLVSGSGDSMLPTIHDREELILDIGQKRLNMQDRIWAISLFGAGALKRLRTIGRDRVLVISDNPDVPDQEVSADDIAIVGRLVGSVKRH